MSDILEIRNRLSYDPHSGCFTWRNGKNRGKRAGTRDRLYRSVCLTLPSGKRSYLEHRLIWFYVHGYWPTEIDHIDRNGLNNKLSNLREVTRSENNQNTSAKFFSKTGIRGVHPEPDGKFRVLIQVNKLRIWGGRFNTLEEAEQAAVSLRATHSTAHV